MEEVRNHPDVEWAFETSLVYNFDIPIYGKSTFNSDSQGQAMSVVKHDFIDRMHLDTWNTNLIESSIWEMIFDQKDMLYNSSGRLITEDEFHDSLATIDTIFDYDIELKEETISIRRSEISFNKYATTQHYSTLFLINSICPM